jgi:protein involved in polysaccharide export with SLBB domain
MMLSQSTAPRLMKFCGMIIGLIIWSLLNVLSVQSQVPSLKLPKPQIAKPGEYDTVGVKNSADVAKETAGLIEQPINPDEYILGPQDGVTVFIGALEPKIYDLSVTPEAKLIIPGIGAISVKGKTLTETEKLVASKVEKVYKTQTVSLSLKKLRQFKVMVIGSVRSPGYIPASPADRLSEVIERAGRLLFNGSQRHITIRREGLSTPIVADLVRFYLLGEKDGNPTLQGGDVINVAPYPEREIVEVAGEVGAPGTYEFVEGDMLSMMLRFSQGVLPSAYLDSIEIIRFRNSGSATERISVNINGWQQNLLTGSGQFPNDVAIHAGDRIFVRGIPDWHSAATVAVKGEVRFPGRYGINPQGTTVADLIARAGGFTENAAIENAVLIRRSDLKNEPDYEYIRLLGQPVSSMTEREKAYYREAQRQVRGMIAIDFTKMSDNNSPARSIFLKQDDSIHIPEKNNFVNIVGRVNVPGKVLYKNNLTYKDYINLAGGYAYKADEGEVLIVKPRGEQLLASDNNNKIEAGDNIMVLEVPESKIKFIDILTTALTITAQIVTVVGVIYTLSRSNTTTTK